MLREIYGIFALVRKIAYISGNKGENSGTLPYKVRGVNVHGECFKILHQYSWEYLKLKILNYILTIDTNKELSDNPDSHLDIPHVDFQHTQHAL